MLEANAATLVGENVHRTLAWLADTLQPWGIASPWTATPFPNRTSAPDGAAGLNAKTASSRFRPLFALV